MYTGCIETVPLIENREPELKSGRFGIGLTTYIPLKANDLKQRTQKSNITSQKVWISDHCGIATGIKFVM